MKKIVALLVVLGLFASTHERIFAQEPTPHEGGSHNTIKQMELDTSTAVKALFGTAVGFNIVGDVIPLVISPDTLNYTDMTAFNIWLKPAFTNLQSGWYTANNKIIPFTEANVESAKYCAKLTIDSPYTNPSNQSLYYLTENTTQISQNIPWTQDLYTYAQFLGSIMSGYRKDANAEGKLEYNKPKDILAKIYKDDCGGNVQGVERSPVNVDVTSHAVFPAGSAIQGIVNVTLYVEKLINGILTSVLDTLNIKMKLVLWKKASMSWSGLLCLLGYGCGDHDSAEVVTNHSTTPNDGFSAMWVSAKQKKDNIGPGNESNAVKILGSVSEKIKYQNPETGINKAYEGMRQAACAFTANDLIPNFKIGGKIPIADACKPKPPVQCHVDSYNEILQKLPKTIDATCTKYKDNLPISHQQCVGMMNEIFNIEIRNDPAWSGSNYQCEHRSDSTAAGPFQIIDETYNIVTCDNERLQDDLKACKTSDAQLSRCTTQDAAELAMRVLLHYSNCKNAGKIVTTAELYTAVCNYGTGDQALPWLNGQTYCEDVFHAAGIPIP